VAQLEPLHKLWEEHRDQVEFVVVYIREAHPEDGWVITSNRENGIAFNDPTSNDERMEAAASCAIRLKIRIPVVVDDIDDKIASAYGALPDRLYLIGRGGKVAYQGEPGPWGFVPKKLAGAIEKLGS
jgi:Iodothyronine deiodinase